MKSILEQIVSPNNTIRDTLDDLSYADVWDLCDAAVTDACTPRPPQAEWFKKWKHWSMKAQEANIFGRNAVVVDMPDDESLHAEYVQKASLCLPVSREWPHAFVGWQVVGG